MKTQKIPEHYHHIAPDGAEVRELMNSAYGGIAHGLLPKHRVSKAACHKTVHEFWHILSGTGAIWLKQADVETITALEPGLTIDIPVNTVFQYRSDDSDLTFIIVTNPPWPGPDEVTDVTGPWIPSD